MKGRGLTSTHVIPWSREAQKGADGSGGQSVLRTLSHRELFGHLCAFSMGNHRSDKASFTCLVENLGQAGDTAYGTSTYLSEPLALTRVYVNQRFSKDTAVWVPRDGLQ